MKFDWITPSRGVGFWAGRVDTHCHSDGIMKSGYSLSIYYTLRLYLGFGCLHISTTPKLKISLSVDRNLSNSQKI